MGLGADDRAFGRQGGPSSSPKFCVAVALKNWASTVQLRFLEDKSWNRLFDPPRQNHKDAGEPVHLYLTETQAIDN